MNRARFGVISALSVVAVALAFAASRCAASDAWTPSDDAWRNDPAWYDGKAEVCTYEASRTIYGKPRAYIARAYTDKERYDPRTTTKSATDDGLEVFKHHWSEQIPTEKYDYRFSTSSYIDATKLEALKLTVSTQEDCGASFKQISRAGDAFTWWESTYFPGGGVRDGRIANASSTHFVDELTLLLRDFPFAEPREVKLELVRSQKDNRAIAFEPVAATVRYIAREKLDLPIGATDAHHLRVEGEGVTADYWFAVDGTAPMLHALVQYADAQGQSYKLKSLERAAYWLR